VLRGYDPTQAIDAEEIENQPWPDLTPAGLELAKQEAEKYLSRLDPAKDALFFASSNQARALETGKIYADIARAKGFEIIKPDQVEPRKSGRTLAQRIGGGDIKVVESLSLHIGNVLAQCVFSPESQLEKAHLHWENVDADLKTRWEQARAVIEADPKGSWGDNFITHSETVKALLPEITTAKELYEKDFAHLTRLAEFGLGKARDSGMQKNIKILAFGHENYPATFLEEVMREEGIKNCEVMHITDTDEGLKGSFRDKEALLKQRERSTEETSASS
jgi:hypothetical protein